MLVVYSSASLQYVQPEHMKKVFRDLAQFPDLKIFLLEPCEFSIKKPDEIQGSLWRGNFSYTHDYKFYAEQAGLITKKLIIYPYSPDDPIHHSTCLYYYIGESKLPQR